MYASVFKFQTSLQIVISHILIFVVAFYFQLNFGFGNLDLFSVLAALTPLFGLFVAIILKDTIAGKYDFRKGRRVNMQMVWITRIILSAYILACFATFYLFYRQVIATPEDLSQWIARIESALGISVGLIVDDLFGGGSAKSQS